MDELVTALVRTPGATNWESWLTLLSRALADENAWMQTVSSLSLEDQFALLEALKTDGSIYSDALRVLTARHAASIPDEEVRDFLLTDATDATIRLGNRLESHRDDLLELVNTTTARRDPGFDLAAEVVQLELQLQQLRQSEIGEKFEAMQQLDREIRTLETFKRSLQGYDAEARAAHREQLTQETSERAARKKELEEAIATAIGQRDTLERDVAAAQITLDELTREIEELDRQLRAVRTRIDESRRELVEASRQHGELVREAAALEQQVQEQQHEVQSETRRLDELRSSPGAQSNQQLLTKLEEVYALLPADSAEADFS